MEIKIFCTNISFAIVGLFCTMGIVGLAVYMSHWYSLMNEEIWKEFFGKSDRNLGLSAATFLTLAVVTAVLSFSFEYTLHFLLASGILQLPSLILTIVVLTRLSKGRYENALQLFKDNYYADTQAMHLFRTYELYLCWGLYNDSLPAMQQKCTMTQNDEGDLPKCCDNDLEVSIALRVTGAFSWIFAFFLCWVIGIALLVPMSFFMCNKSNTTKQK